MLATATRTLLWTASALRRIEPGQTELAHALDNRKEGVALVGETILDAGRHLGEARSTDCAGVFEPAQAVGEGFRTYALQRSLQLAEAATPRRQIADDQGSPAIPDQERRPRNWTGNDFGMTHGHLTANQGERPAGMARDDASQRTRATIARACREANSLAAMESPDRLCW
jgi:hypothetical protein